MEAESGCDVTENLMAEAVVTSNLLCEITYKACIKQLSTPDFS